MAASEWLLGSKETAKEHVNVNNYCPKQTQLTKSTPVFFIEITAFNEKECEEERKKAHWLIQ